MQRRPELARDDAAAIVDDLDRNFSKMQAATFGAERGVYSLGQRSTPDLAFTMVKNL